MDSYRGYIHLHLGCMFAGKTSAGIAEFERRDGKKAAFKCGIDNRYSESHIVTHDGYKLEAITHNANSLSEVLKFVRDGGYRTVLVDEFQFFAEPLVVLDIAALGVDCILVALSGDFLARTFDAVSSIIPHANEIIQHFARCEHCSAPATYTVRKTNDRAQVCIGGSDVYSAVCSECRYHR